jgi:alpha-galactosidase
MASTTYTVELAEHRRWLNQHSWGSHGCEDGPSSVANIGLTPFLTEADAAPMEYAPSGLRPFSGADLVAGVVGQQRGVWWRFDGEDEASGVSELRLAFLDEQTGLRAVLCYAGVPGTDVLRRWAEVINTGPADLRLERFDSAGVCVPTGADGPLLTYLAGEWAREFQLKQLRLPAGRFEIDSSQGVAGHRFAPWLVVQDGVVDVDASRPTWGVSLAWAGSWHIDTDVEPSGITRVRVGRQPHESAVLLAPGATLVTPEVALAYSSAGLGGLARVWHEYERTLAGDRLRPRPVLYNSWEATGFAVEESSQLELAQLAARLGAELFVVDDGWFVGRDNDTGGLGDWQPDPKAFPDGFGVFIDRVRSLGLDVGLWIEPEAVSPNSRLFAEHPEWVYRIEGRASTLIRNQLLLDLGRDDVYEFVVGVLDRLLSEYPISYLKWDMNRPPTERGRPGAGAPEQLDLDGAHVRNYLRVLDHLRSRHPAVIIEGCAGGGARVELSTIGRTDVVWPSDNTGPMDRLAIQFGFLHAHAAHLMSSWVTDAAGIFDTRPKSMRFRFVTAMAGVLGIGADIRSWSEEQHTEAAGYIRLYKQIRVTIHQGAVHFVRTPSDSSCAVQYTSTDGGEVVILAWQTGDFNGPPSLPGCSTHVVLRELDPKAIFVERISKQRYSGSYLLTTGLPVDLSPNRDADVLILERT